jgi:hypothetical protein
MKRTRMLVVATVTALIVVGSGAASAGPVKDFCERSPRDGKAVWYRIVCE